MFVKADVTNDTEADTYKYLAGKQLTYRYTREEGGLMQRRYWQNECQRCLLKTAGSTKTSSTKRPSGWNVIQT